VGQYKRENGLLDFTDLIETCLRDVALAPHTPSVIFADEAQDLNRMQLPLVRKWGERANYFIVAGDDDQTIYSFTGATPEAFLDPDIPEYVAEIATKDRSPVAADRASAISPCQRDRTSGMPVRCALRKAPADRRMPASIGGLRSGERTRPRSSGSRRRRRGAVHSRISPWSQSWESHAKILQCFPLN